MNTSNNGPRTTVATALQDLNALPFAALPVVASEEDTPVANIAFETQTKDAKAHKLYTTSSTKGLQRVAKAVLVDMCVLKVAPREHQPRQYYEAMKPVDKIRELLREYVSTCGQSLSTSDIKDPILSAPARRYHRR